jgi:hypothetical protein
MYGVIAGSHRVAAARRSGHTTIPAIVVEVTDALAKLFSLIENPQRKDISLMERVEGYKALLDLNPAYTYYTLAQDIGVPHQKISQDFQAMEVHTKLQPYDMSVASHLQPTDERRQRGEVLPEYHAVLLHQAMPYLDTADTGMGAGRDGALMLLARKIAPMSQIEARAYIEAVRDGRESLDDPVSQHVDGESPPSWHFKSVRHGSSRRSNAVAKQRMDGGLVTCSCCEQALTLIHLSNGTHQVKRHAFHLVDQLELPGLFPWGRAYSFS